MISNFLNDDVELPVQHVLLFNIADAKFMRFVKQQRQIDDATTTADILKTVDSALRLGTTAQYGRQQCLAFKVNCRFCRKCGHYARVCRKNTVNTVRTENSTEDPTVNDLYVSTIFTMIVGNRRKLHAVNINLFKLSINTIQQRLLRCQRYSNNSSHCFIMLPSMV